MLLSEAFEKYRQDVIVFTNQSGKTEENHFVCLRALQIFFGDVAIESINFEMVRLWKLELEKNRSSETVRNYIVRLRVVLGYCHKNGIICLSPDQVPIPKRKDKVPVYLSKEEVAHLINSTKRIKNKAIISFLYASGLRISELCALNIEQIKDKTFTVVGKGGHARICFIDERTNILLGLYLETRTDNHEALFLSDSGHRITPGAVQDTFRSVRKISGIKCSPHSMRHSYATNLLQSNTNLYHVQKLLGHKSPATTQQYLHVVDYELSEVYNKHHTI